MVTTINVPDLEYMRSDLTVCQQLLQVLQGVVRHSYGSQLALSEESCHKVKVK